MATRTKRAELVAYTLQTCNPIHCDECGALVFTGDSFYHDPSTDAATCSVICAGTLRARGDLRPSPVHAI